MEDEFMVEGMSREASEAVLVARSNGAFLLRMKDDDSFVVSIHSSSGHIDHIVAHRVAGCYECDEVPSDIVFHTVHELLAGIQSARKYAPLTFYLRAALAPPPQTDDLLNDSSAPAVQETTAELSKGTRVRLSFISYSCCVF
jgi:hypothetical protein